MANNLVIPKNYADAAVLFEADLDEIKTALETFINTTLLTGDNIQSGALLGASINDNLLDDTTLEFTSERKITIKDNSLDATKFAVGSLSLPIGSIDDFYIAGSTLTIPRGWMFLNGDVVNETDYEAIHGVGTYTTDDIASSDIDGDTLPDTVGYYILSSDDVALQNTISGDFNTVDLEHNHVWLNRTSAASTDTYFNSTPTATTFPSGSIHGSRISPTIENGTAGIFTGVAILNGTNNLLLAIDAGTASMNKEPENTPTIYIIKVV